MKKVGMKGRVQWLLLGQGVLCLTLSACAGPRMAAPSDVSSSSDVLPVSDRSHASGAGFRADSDAQLGAVEVLYPGQVWLKKGLDEPTRGNVSCLFTGLMLYKPPSDN
jgi:hypothetical protein